MWRREPASAGVACGLPGRARRAHRHRAAGCAVPRLRRRRAPAADRRARRRRESSLSIGREPRQRHRAGVGHRGLARARGARAGRRLVDAGRRRLSRNGSFVNGGASSGRRRLDDGDEVTIGQTVLVFVAAHAQVPATTTTRYRAAARADSPRSGACWTRCAPRPPSGRSRPARPTARSPRAVPQRGPVKSHLHALFELFEVEDMPQSQARRARPPRVRGSDSSPPDAAAGGRATPTSCARTSP